MLAYRALTQAGVTTRHAAQLTGVARATAGRLTSDRGRGAQPRLESVPAYRLTAAEQAEVLGVLNSAEFVDRTPLQVYAVLLDRGRYPCSVSSMYRILAANTQVKISAGWPVTRPGCVRNCSRPAQARCSAGKSPNCAGPSKGSCYDAYVMIDIYSRYTIGACVHATESAVLAQEMMQTIFTIHGTPRVVHADRGTSMTSKTVAALLT